MRVDPEELLVVILSKLAANVDYESFRKDYRTQMAHLMALHRIKFDEMGFNLIKAYIINTIAMIFAELSE